jgi:hypothetical protein
LSLILTGFASCFVGDYKISSTFVRSINETHLPAAMASLRSHIDAPPYDPASLARSVVYDFYQLADQPVRACNQSNVAIWAEYRSKIIANEALAQADAKHAASHWDSLALEATKRTIRAFKGLGIPLVAAAGTLLGWYRQCGIIVHTTDVDFYVPFDYVLSMERFWAIKVSFCHLDFAEFRQKAMNMHGIIGPYRIYGHPLHYGAQIAFKYQPKKHSTSVQIDLFFSSVEGDTFVSPVKHAYSYWLRYEYPNSGFSYIDFFGETVLAPVDIHSYLVAAYGPNYMIPQTKAKCSNCFPTKEVLGGFFSSNKHLQLVGMVLTIKELCDNYTPECVSPYATAHLLYKMLRFIESVRKAHKSEYSLACEAFRYVHKLEQTPPSYMAIAVKPTDSALWKNAIKAALPTTTFVYSEHNDGSLLHLQYSRHNNVTLVVYATPVEFQFDKQVLKFGEFDVPVHKKSSSIELSNLCDTCSTCNKTPRGPIFWGQIHNYASKLCLGIKGQTPALLPCSSDVCCIM